MSRTETPVWVTGLSSISCVGSSVQHLWQVATENQTAIVEGLGYISESTLENLRRQSAQKDLPNSRSAQLALLGAELAMEQAGWETLRPDDGLILATTTGQIPVWDQALKSYLKGDLNKERFLTAFQHQPLGALLKAVSQQLQFHGSQMVLTSACSASTHALMMAAMWIRQGRVKRCLVGGVEVLCDLTIEGFRSLQLLAPQPCLPFDLNRKGINLAEASAFFCLEASPAGTPQAAITGFGMNCDGHHMTAPHPEGKGSFQAMQTALLSAGLEPQHIDWVHAHGTGSEHNDLAEGLALRTLFGEHDPGRPWVSSTKWVHGHTLGASGILEAGLCVHALQQGQILHTAGLSEPDPAIRVKHPQHCLKTPLRHVLKNTLGFGGTNAALVLSHPREVQR